MDALRILHAAGIFTYTNICLTRDLIRAGDLPRYLELVKSLHVGFVQLLEPRPCGGYLADGGDMLLTADDKARVLEFFLAANTQRRYRDYPPIYYVAYTEQPARMGCMGGGLSHLYIDSLGYVNPCVFLPVSFGNIRAEDPAPILARLRRAMPRPLHTECPSLLLADTLRAHAQEGRQPPVPYPLLEREWHTLLR